MNVLESILTMAYFHAWGTVGTPKKREQWREYHRKLHKLGLVRNLLYDVKDEKVTWV